MGEEWALKGQSTELFNERASIAAGPEELSANRESMARRYLGRLLSRAEAA